MKALVSNLCLVFIFSFAFAAPRNHIEERQKDRTYTITCLGPNCPDNPPTSLILPTSVSIPGGGNPPKTTSAPRPTSNAPPPPSTKKTIAKPTSKYTPPPDQPPSKTQKPPNPTQTEEVGPSSTRCPVPLYYQCDGYYNGVPWNGCKECVSGASCVSQNDYYYQCVADT